MKSCCISFIDSSIRKTVSLFCILCVFIFICIYTIVLYLILFTFNQNPNMTSIKVAIRCRPYTVDDKLGVKIRQVVRKAYIV
jgi:hypothetical protein